MIKHLSVVSASVLLLLLPGVAWAGSGDAPDRVIGLLELPQLFGHGACDRYEPRSLALYRRADTDQMIGEIKVDKSWTFPASGGCEGLEVGVHLSAAGAVVQALPTREFGYEDPGAIVLARNGDRFKIRLQDGAAWVAPLEGAEFHPMGTLVAENLSYLTVAWNGTVCAEPGQSGSCRKVDAGAEREPGVTVLGHHEIAGRLWFEIELPSRETCGEPVPGMPRTRGWVSGHDNNGDPAIWFHSRGC